MNTQQAKSCHYSHSSDPTMSYPDTPVASAAAPATATAPRPQTYYTPRYPNGNNYLHTKIEGEYATLEILKKDGSPLPLYTCSHRPAAERWVCCTPGEAFAIRYSNNSSDRKCTRVFDIFVDGVQITDFYMNGGGVHTVDKIQTGTVETGTYVNVCWLVLHNYIYLFMNPPIARLHTLPHIHTIHTSHWHQGCPSGAHFCNASQY